MVVGETSLIFDCGGEIAATDAGVSAAGMGAVEEVVGKGSILRLLIDLTHGRHVQVSTYSASL
jgi:hypothetical protein